MVVGNIVGTTVVMMDNAVDVGVATVVDAVGTAVGATVVGAAMMAGATPDKVLVVVVVVLR